jgi:surface antigen
MKKLTAITLATSLSVVSLSGCNVTRQDWGIVGGAVAGGLLAPVVFGNSAWYTVVGGAALGAWTGSYFGRNLDNRDRSRVGYTLNKAPDHQPYQFMRTSDNNSSLVVTPTKTYRTNQKTCRDFEVQVKEQGMVSYEKSSACKQADGNWQIRS